MGESPYTTGTILHDLIQERLGVGLKKGCACKMWIDRMNVWGPTETLENIVPIVNALLAEAKRREWEIEGRPLLSATAKMVDKTPLGVIIARTWARRLVKEAVHRSEEYEALKAT